MITGACLTAAAALAAEWAGIAQYWAHPKARPEVFDAFVSLIATKRRPHPRRLASRTLQPGADEYAHLSRPGQREIQTDLLYDYRANVASYSAWQALLRDHKPPDFGGPGAERSLVHRTRRRGVQARSAGCRNPPARRLPFRVGREERRNRQSYSCVPGQTFRLTDRCVAR